ncbi:MAG: transglycosylase domain-containing protein [Microthrixaceae bacterium]
MGRPADLISRARARFARLPRWARWPILAGTSVGLLGFLTLVLLWFTVNLPTDPPEIQSAVVVDAQGRELAVLSQDGQRFEIGLDEVAPVVVDALIAAEDRRFYEHDGLDPIGISRALWHNARAGGTQGGSTLTQQLVKNAYLTSERSLWRKAREAVLSVKLERSADKDEILERYLNTVYFGRGAYGIEAAARVYFNTSAGKLDLPQAALLVGLLRSPETADPAEDPEEATARRATVLQDLVQVGKLTKPEAAAAGAVPIVATPTTRAVTLTAGLAPHYVEWIREQTIEAVGADAVYGSGLRVVTTLDLDAQAAAERSVAEVLTEPGGVQAALVALDEDGAIRAYVGGRDFNTLQVDLVRGLDGGGSGRQPGSSFKPFVLEAALEKGITLGDRYAAPPSIELPIGGEIWKVGNYGLEGYGDLSVAEATKSSVNTVYAQLLEAVGPDAVAGAAKRMGIDAELDPVASIALGVEEVSPLDLASAYLTLADDGTRVEPYAIARIEDANGKVLWEPERAEPEAGAIKPELARAVTHALRGVIDGGTGKAAAIGRPAAGKTGTTQDNVDAWFAGYVPGYTAVVWMGYPEASLPMDDVQGRSVTGGSYPAQIWSKFMKAAMEGRKKADFPAPPAELLTASETAALTVAPAEVDAGGTVTVTGRGFELCKTSWSVALEGTPVTSAPEARSTKDERTASIVVPVDLPAGSYRVVARCDSGAGPREAASTTLIVRAPATTSSSTSPSTSTTSTTKPQGKPTTTTTSSSSTSTSSTTSTTSPN